MVDMLCLDQSLTELTKLDARAGQVVELYVFGGLRIEEMAQLQGLTVRTTYRDWRRARAFLVQRLGLMNAVSESSKWTPNAGIGSAPCSTSSATHRPPNGVHCLRSVAATTVNCAVK